jgi:hypothetical protein
MKKRKNDIASGVRQGYGLLSFSTLLQLLILELNFLIFAGNSTLD